MPPAIAPASKALRLLLDRELSASMPGVKVTMKSPDKAREGGGGRQVNLYLFDLVEDAGRRNEGLGSRGEAPFALTLRFIVTAYGEDEDDGDADSHVVLAAVLASLKGAGRFPLGRAANDGFATVSLTRAPIEELWRLWSMFHAPYRLSLVCEVSLFHGEGKP